MVAPGAAILRQHADTVAMSSAPGNGRARRSARSAIDALHATLRRRAEVGEWAEFSRLLAERQCLLQNVSPDERRDVYEAALEANDLLIEKARADRAAAAERIQALKKQKNLDAYYESIAGVRFPDS